MDHLDLLVVLWDILKILIAPAFAALCWLYNRHNDDIRELRNSLADYKLMAAEKFATKDGVERIISDIREDIKELKGYLFDIFGKKP